MSHYEDIRDELKSRGITLFSNSGITVANECTRKYDYQYNQKLMSVDSNENMYRGVVGHAALAEYYTRKMELYSEELCRQAAYEVIYDQITKNPLRANLLMDLRQLIESYFEYYHVRDQFNVLSVETVYTTPVTPTEYFGAILDLVIEFTGGPNKGELAVVDHKFVYNFLNPDVLELDPQLPKYIHVARANGFPVSKGIYNQLRHRQMKDPDFSNLFRREPDKSSPNFRHAVWEEQDKSIAKIVAGGETTATLTHMVCKGCDFRRLCKAELEGRHTGTMRMVEFQTRVSREG